jgi:hypothetical protein
MASEARIIEINGEDTLILRDMKTGFEIKSNLRGILEFIDNHNMKKGRKIYQELRDNHRQLKKPK